MAMDLQTLRKLLALDESDPLSRFALGKKLFELGQFEEAVQHLRFANIEATDHLATYHVLSQVLIELGQTDEAKTILQAGIPKALNVHQGMGKDLAPAMQKMLSALP